MGRKKPVPPEVYRKVFERAESDAGYFACESMIPGVCSGQAENWHHRQLRSQGGKHDVVNGLAVCMKCHEYFHANPAKGYENGWLVKSHADPAHVPVLRRGILARFFEDGSFERVPFVVQ